MGGVDGGALSIEDRNHEKKNKVGQERNRKKNFRTSDELESWCKKGGAEQTGIGFTGLLRNSSD